MMIKKGFLIPAAALVAAALTTVVPARTVSAQAADEGSFVLEEILVTARKRGAESLLDVPIAITALSKQEIEAAGFDNILDIAQATPGFFFESFNTVAGRFDSVPTIRGVTFDSNDPTRQTVSVFVDGVFVSGGTQAIGFEDIERVEVIKGPASALFGRTTFAGAINYVTSDPGDELTARVTGSATSRDRYSTSVLVDGPLIADKLSGRLTASYSDKRGHYENVAASRQQLGDENTWSIGGMLAFSPTDNFRTKLRYYYYEIDDGAPAVAQFDSSFNNFQLDNVIPCTTDPDGLCMGESVFEGVLPSVDPSSIGLNTSDADFVRVIGAINALNPQFAGPTPDQFGIRRDASRISLHSTYEVPNSDVAVDLILGYNDEESGVLQDIDNAPTHGFLTIQSRTYEDTNAELRVSGSALDDRLSWAGGIALYELDYLANTEFVIDRGPTGAVGFFGTANFGRPSLINIKNRSVFVQLGYDLTDQVRLSFEGRYQEDEIDQRLESGPSVNGSPAEFTNFLPRLTIDYKPLDETLLYFSYSKGNKPGGFNANWFTITPAQQAEAVQQFGNVGPTFDEEELDSFELGWKQTALDGRLNFSLSGFFMDRQDQTSNVVVQLTGDPTLGEPPTISTTLVVNAATTDIYGSEFETFWNPTDSLSIRGTLAYVKAEIQSFPPNGDAGDFTDFFGPDADFTGIEAERYPSWQGSLSGTYEKPVEWSPSFLGDSPSWFFRSDLFYSDRYFLENGNLGESPSAVDVNFRTGIRTDNTTVELFVTNAFDEDAPSSADNTSDFVFASTTFNFGVEATRIGLRDRREVGIRFTREF